MCARPWYPTSWRSPQDLGTVGQRRSPPASFTLRRPSLWQSPSSPGLSPEPTWTGRPGAAGWCPARRWMSRSSCGAAASWSPRRQCCGGCRCCCGSGAGCSPGWSHRCHRHWSRGLHSPGCLGTAAQHPGTAPWRLTAGWPSPGAAPPSCQCPAAGFSLKPAGKQRAPSSPVPSAHWPSPSNLHSWPIWPQEALGPPGRWPLWAGELSLSSLLGRGQVHLSHRPGLEPA